MSKKNKKKNHMKNKPETGHQGGAKPGVPDLRRQQAAALGGIPSYPYPVLPDGFPAGAFPADVFPAGAPLASDPPPAQQQQQQPPPDVRPGEDTFIKAMRDLAIAAWKLKGIVFKPGTDEPAAALEAKQLADIGFYAERLNTILGTLGVAIQDFTGQPFHAGMPVKVISAKPTPGLAEEIVFQTLTPTLKFERTGEFYPGNVITLKPDDTAAAETPPAEPPATGQPPPGDPA